METKRNVVIFFDDLKDESQKRLICDELWNTLQEQFVCRKVYIEQEMYGYDTDQDKQTAEQHIHAHVVCIDDKERNIQPWLLVWNCIEHEFTTIQKEDIEDTSYKEQLELHAIVVDYSEDETKIAVSFNTAKNRFAMTLKVEVADGITEEGIYNMSRDIMGRVLFDARYFDRKYPNGCVTDEAMKQLGERMPDIIKAISKNEPYEYKKGE